MTEKNKNKTLTNTIAALATPAGEGSIAVIRISGEKAFEFIEKIFSKSKEKFSSVKVAEINSHHAVHGYIFDGDELIDEVVVTIFIEPNTYTGENLVEISSHGGTYIFRKIISLLIKLGCASAEPGEFTKRAFLNGKMDLSQAEAVADLIAAKTDLARRSALSQLNGGLTKKIDSLREKLINYCSLLELELDFSEEGLEVISKQKLTCDLENIVNEINSLANTYSSGRVIRDGINLTITGKPNAGKSSLFNYLLNDSRAIVTEIPGTTRDYLEESLILGGYKFNLVDTAGIRKTQDIIEKLGVARSLEKVEGADIVLEVVDLTDVSRETSSSDTEKKLTIYNKADLIPNISPNGYLYVSAKTGLNMDKLEAKIVELAKGVGGNTSKEEIVITNQRHYDSLLKSCQHLTDAKGLILESKSNEFIAFEVREALKHLGEIIGKTTNEDILNNIFTKFCIGK